MRSHEGGFVFFHFQGVGSFYTKKNKLNAKVKRVLHPKIIILSNFIHPFVVAKLYEIISSEMFFFFFFFFFHIMEVSGNQNVPVANSLQTIFFS